MIKSFRELLVKASPDVYRKGFGYLEILQFLLFEYAHIHV